MSKPSEHFPESENHSDVASLNTAKTPPSVIINPGFREDPSENFPGANRKFFANTQDRKNFFFIFLALVIFLSIFILLECKESREAKLEKETEATVPVQFR